MTASTPLQEGHPSPLSFTPRALPSPCPAMSPTSRATSQPPGSCTHPAALLEGDHVHARALLGPPVHEDVRRGRARHERGHVDEEGRLHDDHVVLRRGNVVHPARRQGVAVPAANRRPTGTCPSPTQTMPAALVLNGSWACTPVPGPQAGRLSTRPTRTQKNNTVCETHPHTKKHCLRDPPAHKKTLSARPT